MSSASNITISLQSTASSKGIDGKNSPENRGPDDHMYEDGFDRALEKASSDQLPGAGKKLPQGDSMSRERSLDVKLRENHSNLLQSHPAGKLNLITVAENSSAVSDDSLVTFMQDQAFSRAEIMQLFVAKTEEYSTTTQSTVDWLKHREGEVISADAAVLDSVLNIARLRPKNLAEALAAQIVEPKISAKTSRIIEVLAIKDISRQLKVKLASESSDQMAIKITDLMPSSMKNPTGSSLSYHGGSTDSGSFLLSQFDGNNLSEISQGSETQEFREFLTEHLRRAESLRGLTDKLGNMIARQIAGQIGRGRWSLEIAMHPAELGSIEIEMEMTERGLEANFRATQSVTRDLLMESMPRLKSWFEEGGIDVAYTGLTQDSGAKNGEKSTQEQNTQSDVQTTESEDLSDLTDNQLTNDGLTRLDIRV
ncbi:MAG TPA: hypothetical protein DIC49_00270 [Gammaproteobacteria bacterium]|nr:hypothetical protein [Gammaproteobacteria bacterium]